MRIERIEWDGRDAPALAGRLRSLSPALSEVSSDVADILGAVRSRGDEAIRDLAVRLGEAAPEKLRVDPEAIEAAPGLLDPDVRDALRAAAINIAAVSKAELRQISTPAITELPEGQRVELRSEPVPYAGIYAPGGKAAYPSSLLMCAVPARVAGVGRIVVASPPTASTGRPSSAVLAACAVAGIDEVYAIGGAQAIAAFAFGTESVPRVDVIAGPGNRYVTEAKRIVAGQVGIDGVAGPSEIAIVADATADPELLALDLCAQAEHGNDSSLLLISPSAEILEMVAERVDALAAARESVASPSLALVTSPGLAAGARALRCLRARASAARLRGRRRDRRPCPARRLRLRRRRRRDRLRRLRRGLQPRAAHRRRRALRRAPRTAHLHAPCVGRDDPFRGRPGARADGRRARPRRGAAGARRVGRRPQPPDWGMRSHG